MKIDVGLVIQHSIIHGFEQGIQGFSHPHLITKLCRNVGVKWNQKEEVRAPKRLIDDAVVVKIQSDTAEVLPRPVGPSQLDLGLPMIVLITWSSICSPSLHILISISIAWSSTCRI